MSTRRSSEAKDAHSTLYQNVDCASFSAGVLGLYLVIVCSCLCHLPWTFFVTIESSTYTNPARDLVPHSSPEALESSPASGAVASLSYPDSPRNTAVVNAQSLIPTTRPRSELEDSVSSSDVLSSNTHIDAEQARARKRQRIDSYNSTSTSLTVIDHSLQSPAKLHNRMRLTESDRDSTLSASPDLAPVAGPSSAGLEGVAPLNGHALGNGHSAPTANGSSSVGALSKIATMKHNASIARVSLPGTTLYDNSTVDREEFVRLVIQSLRDVGYIESAATLEAESGYIMEAPEVLQFRQYVLDGSWSQAEAALEQLGATDEEGLWNAQFLISQQKYLELLEAQKTTTALQVLRNELASRYVDPDHLHTLSSLIMCSEPEDLRQRAGWDGASGSSRLQLLADLQRYIPSSVMIPQRRFPTLLDQARAYQQQRCLYHNSPSNSATFSLYADHQCDKAAFPSITTTILEVHTNEVWNIEWSHDGAYLASASKDKTAIIWRVGPEREPSIRECAPHHILRDHPYPVGCLAWSLDDSILLTSADNFIKLWNTKTGVCIRHLEAHTEPVTSLTWLPDGSGFMSGSLDRTIIQWDADGKQKDTWSKTAIRITDLAVTPDITRLVAIGMNHLPPVPSAGMVDSRRQVGDSAAPSSGGNSVPANTTRKTESRIVVYDLATKQIESSTLLEGELTSVTISQNSQYALINHAPDEIHLWDLYAGRLARKFTGQRQGNHVIRSCFGGIDGSFVVSGSEDGKVYVWHRDTGALLETLSGHGEGSVNSVAWNPRNERMFASCSDDNTIRIWEAPPPDMVDDMSSPLDEAVAHNGKGKGKIQRHWADGTNF